MTRISGPLSRSRSLSVALLGFAEDMLTPEVARRTPRLPLWPRSTALEGTCGRKPRAFGAMKASNTKRAGRTLPVVIWRARNLLCNLNLPGYALCCPRSTHSCCGPPQNGPLCKEEMQTRRVFDTFKSAVGRKLHSPVVLSRPVVSACHAPPIVAPTDTCVYSLPSVYHPGLPPPAV